MEFVNREVNIDEDILLVDKPVDWTSHDVVAKIRGELGGRVKVGHGGTLDPFATGVLLILIGKATQRFEEIKSWDKEYVVEVELGVATDTGDKTGRVIETVEQSFKLTEEQLNRVLNSFVGEYLQQVPKFSAVKIGGERLYNLARENKEVKLPKRKREIKEIELLELQGPTLKVRVVCGSGTYMRQLAVDIGKRFKLPAHAKELRRTRVGEYRLDL